MKKEKKKILLVEDDSLIALDEKWSLEEFGYEVTTVITGKKAINLIRSNNNFDIILLDINLGIGIDGIETARIIQKKYDIPILFLSNHVEKEIVQKTEQVTSYGYVVKNTGITVLDASIKMAFKLYNANKNNFNKNPKNNKNINNELIRRNKELEIIQKVLTSVLKIEDFTTCARKIFDASCKITGAQSGYVALLNEHGDENEVLFLEAGGLPCSVNPELPMPIRGLRAESYKTGKAIYDNDFMKSKWKKYMPKGHVILNNVMFAPLNIKGKTVGIIGLANKPNGFNNEDKHIAEQLGNFAAIALQKSRHFDIIKQQEEKLRHFYESITDGLFIIDHSYNIILANKNSKNITDISNKNIINKNAADVFSKLNTNNTLQIIKKSLLDHTNEIFIDNLQINKSKKIIIEVRTYPVPEGVLCLIRDITKNKKMEADLEQALKDNVNLLNELQHRIKNNLSMINSIIGLMIRKESSDSTKNAMLEIKSRISALAALYSQLYSSNSISEVRLDHYFEKMLCGIPIDSSLVSITKKMDPVIISTKKAVIVGLITTETITNALKHAFSKNKKGIISFKLEQNKKNIIIEISDNGSGITTKTEKSKTESMGINIIKILVTQLEAHMNISSDQGTTVTISFKK